MTIIGKFYLISFLISIILTYLLYTKIKSFKYVFLLLGIISSFVYIIWRFTVIPFTGLSLVMGILLLIAEIIGVIEFLNFIYFSTRKYKLKSKELENPSSVLVPTVDILICTYNEPKDLLKKTIVGAKCLNYNKDKLKVYVCDDGKRNEIKELCAEYGVNYITRYDNKGAKAGNINNALKYTNGDLVSILDADMIAKNNFLEKTVQYFIDDFDVAFVQVPQSYYNADMYQYNMNANIPNEQDMFMRDIQEARASINAVLHVGTNALFRRKHLDSVGGFPTFSITEDMALGMKLQAKGYKSILVNEPLVLGLSATTLEESIKQRKRWARGNVQVFKRNNPLFLKGLKLNQRLAYLDGLIYWFSSLQKIIYIIAPTAYLLFGILSIKATILKLIPVYLPFLISQIIVFKFLSSGTRNLKWSHYYETVMAPSISASIISELLGINPIGFKVTTKDIMRDKGYFQFRFILPHLILLAGTIMSWGICIYLIRIGKLFPSYIILNLIWSIYNAFGLFISIKIAYQKPIFRNTERVLVNEEYKLSLKIGYKKIEGNLKDISDKGMGIKINEKIKIEKNEEVYVKMNELIIKGRVARAKDKFIGIEFINLDTDQEEKIIKIYIKNLKPYYTLKRDLKKD